MKTYLVGGAVRDRLLGLPPGDRDWVVVGATPEAMVAAGFTPVGRDFPVFLHPATQEEHALARTERKSGRGYQGFTVQASPEVTLEEDLARRDLTIDRRHHLPGELYLRPRPGDCRVDTRVDWQERRPGGPGAARDGARLKPGRTTESQPPFSAKTPPPIPYVEGVRIAPFRAGARVLRPRLAPGRVVPGRCGRATGQSPRPERLAFRNDDAMRYTASVTFEWDARKAAANSPSTP